MDLKLNPNVGVNRVVQVIFVNKVLGYVGELDAYIFWAVEGGLEIEVIDVKSEKCCAFAGKDNV